MGKYSDTLIKEFMDYLQTLTDQQVNIDDAQESMDNLINLYLQLAEIEKSKTQTINKS